MVLDCDSAPLSLAELEEHEELVWELLSQLRPLLEMLDELEADDVTNPETPTQALRVQAMLRLFAAGVDRARALLPELRHDPRDGLRLPLTAEEHRARAGAGAILERTAADPRPVLVATSDGEALRLTLERARRADQLERVAEAIALLRTEMDFAAARIDRRASACGLELEGGERLLLAQVSGGGGRARG